MTVTGWAWDEPWATPPDALDGAGWAHHGLAVAHDGRIVGARAGDAAICIFEPIGELAASWPSGLTEAHGLALAGPARDQRLWVADPGFTMVPHDGGYALHRPAAHGRVVCFDLRGARLGELPTPPPPDGAATAYAPTGVAVDEARGSIWVADGYGRSLVHRFSPDGALELTLSGEEGAGRFDCPHAVFIDRRADAPRLYVTDRGNACLQVYDLDGAFLHAADAGLRSPSALVALGEELIVAELDARLTVLDAGDRVVEHLGWDEAAPRRAGWPNAIAADGTTVRPPDLRPWRFNSPHGLAADARGNLYVAEWLVGGRLIRLLRQP